MSHRTSLVNNEDPLVAQQDAAQVVNQSSTSKPSTMQHSVQESDLEAQNTTNTPPSTSAIIAFLNSMNSHYATLSDPVTPHRFNQLCKDYNASKTDETSFYVAVYRLFYETKATHLIPGLRAFLPTTWREVDLEWLNKAIEGDSERQRVSAREALGELAAMAESGVSVPSTPSGSAAAQEKLDDEASAAQPEKSKKRTPLKGFRASYRTELETPLSPRSNSDQSSTYLTALETPLSPRSVYDQSSTYQSPSASTPPVPRGRAKNNTAPSKKKIPLQKNQSPAFTTSALPASETHATPTPTPSTPPPINKASKLPSASSITHLGTIYPSTLR